MPQSYTFFSEIKCSFYSFCSLVRDGAKRPTLLAPSPLATVLKFENGIFDLGSQIPQMEGDFAHQVSTILTIPAQPVH